VKSVERQGTTFTFTLRSGCTADVAPEPAREWLQGHVAMVVDACNARRSVLAKRLSDLGLEVVVAAPTADAVRAALATGVIRYALVTVEADQAPALTALEILGVTSPETTCVALAPLGMTLDASHPGSARVAGTIPLPWGSEQIERRLADLIAGPIPRARQTAPSRSEPCFDSGLLVLLAEDNPVNQKVARMTLKRLGLRCEIVGNGRLALEAVARTRFDLVLMDCQMPELDGYEATAALRALERDGAPRLTIIAMTANSMSSDRERCLAAGMDDYIPKPINFDVLRATLARHLPVAAVV
jgi:two-component system sensor histidine kinase/response regulator